MCVPVHVYSSLPLERFVQVWVRDLACTIGAWLSACVSSV